MDKRMCIVQVKNTIVNPVSVWLLPLVDYKKLQTSIITCPSAGNFAYRMHYRLGGVAGS